MTRIGPTSLPTVKTVTRRPPRAADCIRATRGRGLAQVDSPQGVRIVTVLLDTFSQLSGVDDENNAAMVARALRAPQSIREAGNRDTAVLLVHHTTKSGSSYRESTALLGNVDSMMMVTGSSANFTLSNRASEGGKLKNGTPLRGSGFAIESSKGGSAHVARSGADLVRDAVLEVLDDGEWLPRSDFGNPGGSSDSTMKRRVRELVEQDVLTQQGEGPATVYALAAKQVF